MRVRDVVVLGVLAVGLGGCEESAESNGVSITVEMPYTVQLIAERALVVPSGEVLDNPNFKAADLVTYRSSGVKISSGCPVHNADCMPIHVCRPTLQSLPTKFTSIDEVCADVPEATEGSAILEATEGMGFTVQLNTIEGIGRFWVKSVEGVGASARVTLVYDLLADE